MNTDKLRAGVAAAIMQALGASFPHLDRKALVDEVATELTPLLQPEPAEVTHDWVSCPVCGEPDMEKHTDKEGNALIYCVNHACASNGGSNKGAIKKAEPAPITQIERERNLAFAYLKAIWANDKLPSPLGNELFDAIVKDPRSPGKLMIAGPTDTGPAPSGEITDTQILDWLEKNTEVSINYESGNSDTGVSPYWIVFIRRANKRWDFLIRVDTFREAVKAAMAAKRGEGGVRKETCIRCGTLTADWIDTEETKGRVCRGCESHGSSGEGGAK
jgi:hypothetical protein